MAVNWRQYRTRGYYDELIRAGRARPGARPLVRHLAGLGRDELTSIQSAAELAIKEMGITFTVYSEEEGSIDRNWPFDIIPRIIPAREWRQVEQGLKQRVSALNRFIDDVYHGGHIFKDGVLDKALLAESENFRSQCVGVSPPLGVWAHICGTDLVLQLPRGAPLLAGEWLTGPTEEGWVRVEAAPERLLAVRSGDAMALLQAAYHLGNRHVVLQLLPGELRLEEDPVLADLLRGRGLEVAALRAPFEPEPGAYAPSHLHRHSHGAASSP